MTDAIRSAILRRLPPAAARLVHDLPGWTPALERAARWADGRSTSPVTSRPVLAMSGGAGAGKTVAGLWLAARAPRGAAWIQAHTLGAFAPWDDPVLPAVAHGDHVLPAIDLRTVERLVIDDLGVEAAAVRSRVGPLLVALLTYREAAQLETIVTTNGDLRRDSRWLTDTYGEALASRIGAGDLAAVSGDDLRLPASRDRLLPVPERWRVQAQAEAAPDAGPEPTPTVQQRIRIAALLAPALKRFGGAA